MYQVAHWIRFLYSATHHNRLSGHEKVCWFCFISWTVLWCSSRILACSLCNRLVTDIIISRNSYQKLHVHVLSFWSRFHNKTRAHTVYSIIWTEVILNCELSQVIGLPVLLGNQNVEKGWLSLKMLSGTDSCCLGFGHFFFLMTYTCAKMQIKLEETPGRLAQSGASLTANQRVAGSSPVRPHSFVDIWSWKKI